MPTGLVERLDTVTFLGKLIKAIVGSNLKTKIDIHVFVISIYIFSSGILFRLLECMYFFSHESFIVYSPRLL